MSTSDASTLSRQLKFFRLLLLLILIAMTSCNPGGTSTKHSEGPIELFAGVTHEGTVAENGISQYWIQGLTSGQNYSVFLLDVWSSVTLTVQICNDISCNETFCDSGKSSSCNANIITDSSSLSVFVHGGINASLTKSEKINHTNRAGIIGASYTIYIQ